jgi:hypothetical protein
MGSMRPAVPGACDDQGMEEQARQGDPGPAPTQATPPTRPSPTAPGPPPPEAWQQPVRIEPVPGTPYGLAILGPPEATSGPAVGALVAGAGSSVVALVVACLGLAGARPGWGLWVAGAFAVLAGCLGVAGVGLGIAGMRQTRRRPSGTQPAVRGRGMAVAGLASGATGVAITTLSLVAVAAIQLV